MRFKLYEYGTGLAAYELKQKKSELTLKVRCFYEHIDYDVKCLLGVAFLYSLFYQLYFVLYVSFSIVLFFVPFVICWIFALYQILDQLVLLKDVF